MNTISYQHHNTSHQVYLISPEENCNNPPVLFLVEVGVAHSIIHAAGHQLVCIIHNHLAHLVAVALTQEVIIIPSFCIPVMCREG